MIRNNIVTYATILGGTLLALTGLLGVCFPNFLGLQLSALTNLVHLASGLMAMYLGLKSASMASARNFCLGIGAFYCLLGLGGLAGFTEGGLAASLVHLVVGAGFAAAAIIQPLPSTIYSPR